MSKFKIAIANVVSFAVKFELNNGAEEKRFAFTVTADRMSQNAITERLKDKGETISEFMRDVITGWDGQRLVLTEDGQPAEYSPEARDAMLDVAGVATVIFNAYLTACGARAKN